jgi:hypothetical protein
LILLVGDDGWRELVFIVGGGGGVDRIDDIMRRAIYAGKTAKHSDDSIR